MPLIRSDKKVTGEELETPKDGDDAIVAAPKPVEKNETLATENGVDDHKKVSSNLINTENTWEPVNSTKREPVNIQMMRLQGIEVTDEEIANAYAVNEGWIGNPDDVTFEVDHLQLMASKRLLVAASAYFKSILTAGVNKIFVDDYPFEAVQELINWIENEGYEPNATMDLLQLSAEYRVEALTSIVEHKMTQKLNQLNVHDCLLFVIRCDESKALVLKRLAMKFILRNWKDVVHTAPDFNAFIKDEPELLVDLLNMSTECVNMQMLNEYL